MSRVANMPVNIPEKVEVVISQYNVQVKGPLGELNQSLTGDVKVNKEDNILTFQVNNESKFAKSMSGTLRALVNNMVTGVSAGFEKKLTLIGVGYKAQVQGNKVNLDLGFSHPIIHDLPEGITAQAASPTELVIKGSNKQVVGQVAAEIRGYRPPEPYKGKGVRYADERVVMKEAKKQ
jgi:large subunit ribosomal protein L6